MKKMKKTHIAVLIALIIFLGGPVCFFSVPIILNNILLASFANQLDKVDLPENTQIIERASECGKLYGTNGNHMDFLACILVKTDCSLEDLNDHYSSCFAYISV